MYNCQNCQNTSQRTEKQHKIIVATRSKKYYNKWIEYKKDGTPVHKKEFAGEGTEIVKEVILCTACEDRYVVSEISVEKVFNTTTNSPGQIIL